VGGNTILMGYHDGVICFSLVLDKVWQVVKFIFLGRDIHFNVQYF